MWFFAQLYIYFIRLFCCPLFKNKRWKREEQSQCIQHRGGDVFSHSISHILDACLVPLKHRWKLFFSQGSKMSWGGAQEYVYTAGDCDSRDRGSLPVSHTSWDLGYTNRCKKSNQLSLLKICCHIAIVLLKLYWAVFEFACVCLWDSSVGGRSTWNSHMVGNYYQEVLLNNSQSCKVPTQYSSLVISVETGDRLLLQMADKPKFLCHK